MTNTEEDYEFLYCKECGRKYRWEESVFSRQGKCGECGAEGRHSCSKIHLTKEGGIFTEKISALRENKSAIARLRKKHRIEEYDPRDQNDPESLGKYSLGIWIGESGKHYFLGPHDILSEDGNIFKYPTDKIEFAFPGSMCFKFKDGFCQVLEHEKMDLIRPDQSGELVIGSACCGGAMDNILCGFHAVYDLKKYNEWKSKK